MKIKLTLSPAERTLVVAALMVYVTGDFDAALSTYALARRIGETPANDGCPGCSACIDGPEVAILSVERLCS
jgi:hypothetical protein